MPNPGGYTGYQGSVYPSDQIGIIERGRLPMFAGSDIWQGAPVTLASMGDWTVIMCTTSAQKPLGVARDFAAAGTRVAVKDFGNVVRAYPGVGASFAREAYVGVVGTSSGTHPISGANVSYPVIGQVTGTPSVAVGASFAPVWAVGQAWESAAIGDQAAYRIEPALLVGLVNSN